MNSEGKPLNMKQQVYRSEKHGFEFSYPSKYQSRAFFPEDGFPDEFILLQEAQDIDQPESPYIAVKTYLNPGNLSLTKFRDDTLRYSVIKEGSIGVSRS